MCKSSLIINLQKVGLKGFAAGIRQVVTGLAELKRKNGKILCTSMCVGSGMGAAGIFVNEATR